MTPQQQARLNARMDRVTEKLGAELRTRLEAVEGRAAVLEQREAEARAEASALRAELEALKAGRQP